MHIKTNNTFINSAEDLDIVVPMYNLFECSEEVNTEVLKPNLCDWSDSYILIRGDITIIAAPAVQVSFKTCAPFAKCITKIDGTTIDDAEDLDLVMPM